MAKKANTFSLRNLKPDYLFWIRKGNWNIYEALFLLFDVEPRVLLVSGYVPDKELPSCPEGFEQTTKEYYELLLNGPFDLLSKSEPARHASFFKKDSFEQNKLKYTRHCSHILTWANENLLSIPNGLVDEANKLNIFNKITDPLQKKNKKHENKPHGNARRFSSNREKILGAALCALNNCRDKCKDRTGKISGAGICKVIESERLLSDDDMDSMSINEMSRLINKSLKLE